jgi:hypothetical protein
LIRGGTFEDLIEIESLLPLDGIILLLLALLDLVNVNEVALTDVYFLFGLFVVLLLVGLGCSLCFLFGIRLSRGLRLSFLLLGLSLPLVLFFPKKLSYIRAPLFVLGLLHGCLRSKAMRSKSLVVTLLNILILSYIIITIYTRN